MTAPLTSPDQASTWLQPDQIEVLRTACYDDRFQSTQWQRNEAIVTVLYDTGLRVSELVQLDVDHLDLDTGTIQIPATEQSKSQTPASSTPTTLELDPEHTLGTGRLLTSYLHHREDTSSVLFPSRNGGRLTPKAIRDLIAKAAACAEIRPYTPTDRGGPADISPQTLRHSTAWRLLTVENRSLSEVRDRLRHTALSTTRNLYATFTDESDRHTEIRSSDRTSRETLPEREILGDLLATIPDLLFAFDTDGQMLWWNTRVTDITGYRDVEVADMHPLDFVAPTDKEQIAEAIARVTNKEAIEPRETYLVTKDGDYLPYEFTGAPLTDDDGSVWGVAGVGRDISILERFERISDGFYTLDTDWRFTSLNSQAEALVDSSEEALLGTVFWEEFPDAVEMQIYDEFHTAMETQDSVSFEQYYPPLDTWFEVRAYPSKTGLSVYFRDITARKEREQELEQYRTLTEAANDVIVTINDKSIIQTVNPAVTDVFGYDPDELVGEPLTTLMTDDLAAQHRTALQQYLETGERTLDWSNVEVSGFRADGSEIPVSISFSEAKSDGQRFFTGIIRDITERREREQELEQQRSALTQLNQFNALVQNLIHALVEESTRTEIEQTVCEQLAASDFYQAAWIGEPARNTDEIRPRVGAGIDPDDVSNMAEATDTSSIQEIANRAAETEDVCVAKSQSNGGVNTVSHDQREAAEIESTLAVPITHEDALYGVLVVYATDTSAFDERQQTSFAELAENIGFAIAAAERKEALVAENVLELTLSIRDPDQFFIQMATRFDATVTLEGITGRDDDAYLEYFTVTGASPEEIRDLADQNGMVDHVRVVSSHDTECLCEVGVADSSITTTVAEFGGAVTGMTAEGKSGTVWIEFPRTVDVSRVIDALQATVADVELQAKETVDRPLQTEHRFQVAVTDRLTEKQRDALETAYLAGFFEQPRDSTGEDIAESMGISPSTLHQHLRVGLQKLVGPIVEPSTADA